MIDHPCVFCAILHGEKPATVVINGINNIGIVPLNPCTDGHLLVIPRVHVTDALEDPEVTAAVMHDAALWPKLLSTRHKDSRYENVNIITSVGPAATQTVFHLHLHIVPRHDNDGLHLPWTTP